MYHLKLSAQLIYIKKCPEKVRTLIQTEDHSVSLSLISPSRQHHIKVCWIGRIHKTRGTDIGITALGTAKDFV